PRGAGRPGRMPAGIARGDASAAGDIVQRGRPTMWSLLKAVHVKTVLITGVLFALRGFWLLRDPQTLRWRVLRIVPHANDTVLLLSGIGLAVLTAQYPGPQPWLTAKVAGLLVYIGLGITAFRIARTPAQRTAALVAALLVLAYIVLVALTR